MGDKDSTALVDLSMPNTVENVVIPAVHLELSQDEPELNYRPKFPLPDDLNLLPRDQTVCRYCGVSYLVLSEIKQLEERIEHQSGEITNLLNQIQSKDEQIVSIEVETVKLRTQLEDVQKNEKL
ncbi:hypothetical protein FBUS_08423 [Fasciolopsis buskii]|uniref:Uncharacterized protein n=1 Tax=Fasciolopsis buskii TaxID=27845 RepID=A0A8E0RR91_9TREM|nr:hypothetical protein FBUS_08423 [Fasciolopsis buski]